MLSRWTGVIAGYANFDQKTCTHHIDHYSDIPISKVRAILADKQTNPDRFFWNASERSRRNVASIFKVVHPDSSCLHPLHPRPILPRCGKPKTIAASVPVHLRIASLYKDQENVVASLIAETTGRHFPTPNDVVAPIEDDQNCSMPKLENPSD